MKVFDTELAMLWDATTRSTSRRLLLLRHRRASLRSSASSMDAAGSDSVKPEWSIRCDILFKAWVQVRYHRRRQRFFDLVDKITKALTVALSASLLGDAVKKSLPEVASAISLLSLMALVFGYADRKQTHKELAELAAKLAADIYDVEYVTLGSSHAAKWQADFARLALKAPPPLKNLTLICEREQALADGSVPQAPLLHLHQRLLADFFSVGPAPVLPNARPATRE